MRESFDNEIDYICRRTAMCEKFKKGICADSLLPDKCKRALKAVEKVNKKLVLGNNPIARMSYEDYRICHDLSNELWHFNNDNF